MTRTLLAVLSFGLVGSAAAQTACSNAFMPSNTGWIWNYQVKSTTRGAVAETSQTVVTLVNGPKLTRVTTTDGIAQRSEYKCQGGNLISLVQPQIDGATVTSANVSGVSIPADSAWAVGKTWQLVWNLTGRKGILSGTGSFTTTFKIVGTEKVSVPAGTFEAFKVTSSTQIVGQAAGMKMNQNIGSTTQWFARNVGLVKAKGENYEMLLTKLAK